MIANDPVLASSVLILDTQKSVVGTGFVVSIFHDNTHALILTSTSAVERATSQLIDIIQKKVQIKFHIDTEGLFREARISGWFPSDGENICALEVIETDKLPPRLRALPLNLATNLEGRKVSIFGHPESEPTTFDGRWQHSEFYHLGPKHKMTNDFFLQIGLQDISEGFKGAPVWDNARRHVLGMVTHIEYNNEPLNKTKYVYAIPVEILHMLYQSVLKKYTYTIPVRFEKPSPFHDDEPYTEGEAHLFFGYEEVTERIKHIADTHPKVLAILGPEKSGKTSVIQAGLIPKIKNEARENYHKYGYIKVHLSSKEPLEDLQQQGLNNATQGMRNAIHQLCQTYNYDGLYLILDQFEDFLSQCPFDTQKFFIDQLLEALEERTTTAIIVLRDNFYSLLARHKKLMHLAELALVNVFAPREKEQLLTIVEKYTEQGGIKQNTEELSQLIDQVLTNIENETGRQNSPLARINHYLAHKEHAQETALATHIAVKDPSISLSVWADNILLQFNESQQQFIKHLLTETILIGDEALGIPDKKYYVPIEQMCKNADEYEVVEELIKHHFLSTNRSNRSNLETITIAQDELIYEWPRFRTWLDEKRQFLFWRKQIQQQADDWRKNNNNTEKLLQGFQLEEAEKWYKMYPEAFDNDFRQFVASSRDEQQQIIQTRRKASQQRIIAQHQATEQQRHHKILSRYLVTQALDLYKAPSSIQQGVQLAAAALFLIPSPGADTALRQGIIWLPRKRGTVKTKYAIQMAVFSQAGRYVIACDGHGEIGDLKDPHWNYGLELDTRISTIAFSPNGNYLAVAETNGKIHICYLEKEVYRETVEIVDTVTALLFSPDNRYFAIVHRNNHHSTLIIKDCTNWTTTYTNQYIHPTTAINFDTSGSIIALGSINGSVEIYKLGQKGVKLQFTKNYKNAIKAIALNLSASYLAIAFENKEVEIIRIDQNQPLFHYQHQSSIQFIIFSPDGRYVATGSDDTTVRIYDVLKGKELRSLEHQEAVYMGAFSHDNAYLATVSRDKMIKIWDVDQSFNLRMHYYQEEAIQQIAFSPDKYYIFVASHNSIIHTWDIASSNQSTTIPQKSIARVKSSVHTLFWTLTRDTYTLLIASEKKPAEVWIFREGYSLYTQQFSFKKVTQKLLYSSKENYLAAIGSDQYLYLWHSTDDTQPNRIRNASHITCIAFSPDGHFLATGSQRATIVSLWNVPGGQKWADLPHVSLISTLAFTPDGHILITGCDNGEIRLWNWRDEKTRYICTPCHNSKVTAITVTLDGQHFATTSESGEVYVWKLEGTHILSLPQKGYIHAIQFTSSGRYLVTASNDGNAYMWDAIDGHLRHTLPHQKEVTCLAISPDGEYIATGSKDQNVGIWDIVTGQQLASFTHSDEVVTLLFSPDGKYIAVGCSDATVKIWLWHPGDLIEEAMSRVTSVLTKEEWEHYADDEPYQIISDLQSFPY